MKKSLALVGLLASSVCANAAIIDNGNYTTDTISGLDWLDLTETTGRNYNDVYEDITNSGGDFDAGEWRYASQSEFQSLISNWFGFTYTGGKLYTESYSEFVESFIGTFGDTLDSSYDSILNYSRDVSPDGAGATLGLLADICVRRSGNDQCLGTVYDGEFIYRETGEVENDFLDYFEDTGRMAQTKSGGHVGSYLVRTSVSAVPVPAAIWLFVSALFLTGWMRRKAT